MGGVAFGVRDRLGEPVHEVRGPVRAPLEADPAERVPEDREPGPGSGFLAVEAQLHLGGAGLAGQPLGEHVRQSAQVVGVGRADAGQPQPVSGVLGGPAVAGVGGEVVVGGGCGGRLRRQIGEAVFGDRGPVVPEDRPAVRAPAHRLEVHDPAVGAALLEVQEPVLPGPGAHPAALVGAVDVGVLLLQDDPLLVRPEEAARAEGALPARLHPTGGGEDPEPAVVPVELGAFEGEPAGYAVGVDDHLALVEEFGAVGAHTVAGEAVLDPRAGLGPGVHQIGLAGLVVPQGAGVDQALAGLHQVRAGPGASDLRGVDLEDALVGVAPEDPEALVVIPEGRGPDTAVVPGRLELLGRFEALQGVADQSPVHQVAGVQ